MKIKFVRQDFWIGLYWKTEIDVLDNSTKKTTWYVCIIPMFPIIWVTKK